MFLIKYINALKKTFPENKEILNDLDQQIGDGDHGTNISRGIEKIQIDMIKPDLSTTMMNFAMTIISNVGGAFGPLVGTFLMELSKQIKKNNNLNNLPDYYYEACKAVGKRGNSWLNDKTMLDVLVPVGDAWKIMKNNLNYATVFIELEKIARKELERTKSLQAKKGRASYLGERSINVYDPGAYSCWLAIKTAMEVLNND